MARHQATASFLFGADPRCSYTYEEAMSHNIAKVKAILWKFQSVLETDSAIVQAWGPGMLVEVVVDVMGVAERIARVTEVKGKLAEIVWIRAIYEIS